MSNEAAGPHRPMLRSLCFLILDAESVVHVSLCTRSMCFIVRTVVMLMLESCVKSSV